MSEVGIRVDSIYYSLVDIKHGKLFAEQYYREPEKLEPFALIDAEVVDITKFIDAHIDPFANGSYGELPSIPTIRKLVERGGAVEIGVHGREAMYPCSFKDTCIVIKSDSFASMHEFEHKVNSELAREVLDTMDTALGHDLMWFEREVVKAFKQYNRTLYNTLRNEYTRLNGDDWETHVNASTFADVCELGKMRRVLCPPAPKSGGKGGEFIIERTDKNTVGGKYV
tara:strand:+ start:2233 stop:2910 length:678 start_codon:yes stop_codon:yes gene_type:complete